MFYAFGCFLYFIGCIIVNIFYRPLYFFRVYNKKRMNLKGGAVLVCNHLSGYDPVFVLLNSTRRIKVLAKTSVAKSRFLKYFGAMPIDRDNPTLTQIKDCIAVLKKGKRLLVFPEGTRNRVDTEIGEVKGGAVIFAIKAKKPIVPIIIYRKIKIFRRNYMMIGKPFELSEYYDKKLTSEELEKISGIVRGKMLEVQEELGKKVKRKK